MAKKKSKKERDFQKVKFKVGKKLPKADNYTSTAFKSKGIVIKEQLKDTSTLGQVAARAAKKPQELLAHLTHLSKSFRHNALNSIKEIIQSNPKSITLHVAQLVERVASLANDKQPDVRSSALDTLKVLLTYIGVDGLRAYSPIILAHLRCSMTHLEESIKIDSIKFLNFLIQEHPQILYDDIVNVVENFLDLVSTGSTNRTLRISPHSKMSSHKWRAEVLSGLCNLYNLYQKRTTPHSCGDNHENYHILQQSKNRIKYFTECYPGLTQRNLFNISSGNGQLSLGSQTSDIIIKLVEQTTPLLRESIIEFNEKEGDILYITNYINIINCIETMKNILEHINTKRSQDVLVKLKNLFIHEVAVKFPFKLRHSGRKDQESALNLLNIKYCQLSMELDLSSEHIMEQLHSILRSEQIESSHLQIILNCLHQTSEDELAVEYMNSLSHIPMSIIPVLRKFIGERFNYHLLDVKYRHSYIEILLELVVNKTTSVQLVVELLKDLLSYVNRIRYVITSAYIIPIIDLCESCKDAVIRASLINSMVYLIPYSEFYTREVLSKIRHIIWTEDLSQEKINFIIHSVFHLMNENTSSLALTVIGSLITGVCGSTDSLSCYPIPYECNRQIATAVLNNYSTYIEAELLSKVIEKCINLVSESGEIAIFTTCRFVCLGVISSCLTKCDHIESKELYARLIIDALMCSIQPEWFEYKDAVLEHLRENVDICIKEMCNKIRSWDENIIELLLYLRSQHEQIDWTLISRLLTKARSYGEFQPEEITSHRNLAQLLSITT